jgi:protoporphyrinogen/coproporphyrinogen III oxidase
MFDVIIIGGGITGLSAAWELQQTRPNATYALLEASNRWGGKIISQTIEAEGKPFLVDGGPDTLITRKPETWQLTAELGLESQVSVPASETKNIYVLDGGQIQPIPLNPALFLRTPLLTWRGRLRLMAEPFQPARHDDGDESLADFATRRLGREALEKFIGPVLGGIYNTDPTRQSILVSSPIMREMEKESGSLVLAALARAFKKPKGPKKPRFINYEKGMGQLPDTLAAHLRGTLRLNASASRLEHIDTGLAVKLASGETLEARTVILATLAHTAADLLADLSPASATLLRQIRHENIGTLSLVYRDEDIPAKPVINGLMIPRREQRAIDAVTVSSRKMPQRSHPGYTLLRVFFGGAKPELVTYDDEKLLAAVRAELRDLLNIQAEPLAHDLYRWPAGFPQAEVGHLDRIDAIEASLPAGIVVAGSSYRGIAVPDCIKQGREAAKKVTLESNVS